MLPHDLPPGKYIRMRKAIHSLGEEHGPRKQQVAVTIEGEAGKARGKAAAELDQPESHLAAAQAGDLVTHRPGYPRVVPRRRSGLSDPHERRPAGFRGFPAGQSLKMTDMPDIVGTWRLVAAVARPGSAGLTVA